MTSYVHERTGGRIVLIAGILLIAANLRAPFTGLPPLLGPIQAEFGLSTAASGALTTLPLLAFALLSPFSARLAHNFGLGRALFGALVLIALGIGLRSAGTLWALYLGTCIIGMGIAVGNVLLPSLVKRDFPRSIGALTSAYVLMMGIAAAIGSAAVIPIAEIWGWSWALASFLALPLVTLLVWVPQLGARAASETAAQSPRQGATVWRSALAWQVTLFLGLNSTIYYVAVAWLPAILVEAGLPATQTGSVHGVMQLATAVPGLLLGAVLGRVRDQRIPAVAAAIFSAVALLGLLLAPQLAYLWSVLFGIGTGAGMIMGLAFIGMRTGNAQQAAALSGMAQCVGYLLAAAGPMAIGALHDVSGNWSAPLALCAALALGAAVTGILAGRNISIGSA